MVVTASQSVGLQLFRTDEDCYQCSDEGLLEDAVDPAWVSRCISLYETGGQAVSATEL